MKKSFVTNFYQLLYLILQGLNINTGKGFHNCIQSKISVNIERINKSNYMCPKVICTGRFQDRGA